MLRISLPASLLLLGCAAKTPDIGVAISTGQETDTMSKSPAVVRVDVAVKSADGSVNTSASAAPGGQFDLGDVPSDASVTVDVSGVSSAGDVVVRGRSLDSLPLAAVNGVVPVFVERLNGWSRPPGSLGASHPGGVVATLAARYLALTGGDSTTADLYDVHLLGAVGSKAPLPRTAASMVGRTSTLLLVDTSGATLIDFDQNTTTDVPAPTGLTFAEIAGGATIDASDGRSFIVGATRTPGAPTAAVLVIDAAGAVSAAALTAPRAGAAAAWVEGLGLVVAGGSATAAGVEVLAPTATAFQSKPFPPDEVAGAGVFLDPFGQVALAGGGDAKGNPAPMRELDLTCGMACAATEIAAGTLPSATVGTRVFAVGPHEALIVGEEMGKATRTFAFDFGGMKLAEIGLREGRRGASVMAAPNRTLAIVGGEKSDGTAALSVEMYSLGE